MHVALLQYFDYVMRVMLPEILIKIYMHVHGLTHAQTEQAMCEALNTPGAIFIWITDKCLQNQDLHDDDKCS